MTRLLPFVIVLLAATASAEAADVRVTPVVREGRVWISCSIADGFTPELRDAIRSGLSITFTYDIELRRTVPIWPDRTLTVATVAVSVTYDSLTRRHQLERIVDGRIQATKVTEDEAEVRKWLTGLESLPIFATSQLEANTEYYIRVRARTQPHDSVVFWPWDRGLSVNTPFTFIP